MLTPEGQPFISASITVTAYLRSLALNWIPQSHGFGICDFPLVRFLEGTFCIVEPGATSATLGSPSVRTPCQRVWKGRGRAEKSPPAGTTPILQEELVVPTLGY